MKLVLYMVLVLNQLMLDLCKTVVTVCTDGIVAVVGLTVS